MKRVLVIGALVIALMAPAVPVAARSRAAAPSPMASAQVQVLKFVSDHVALLKIPLPPMLKAFINGILRAMGPQICAVVASLADPAIAQQLNLAGICEQIMAGPDPLGDFVPLLDMMCTNNAEVGQIVFPKYKDILPVLCGILV